VGKEGGAAHVTGQKAETFAYADVEHALAEVFEATGEALVSLRGRLKAFQKAGITPDSPGRGRVIRYSVSDVYDWALCLSLADFGMTPEKIKVMVTPGQLLEKTNKFPNNDAVFMVIVPPSFRGYEVTEKHFVSGRGMSADSLERVGRFANLAICLSRLKTAVDRALDNVR
jgi:hypothetical protein